MKESIKIEDLRKLAKLNMDEKCFTIYKSLIEPNIKSMVENYFQGWQDIEKYINLLIMRHQDVFKTKWLVIKLDSKSDEKYVDVEKFNQVKYKKFSWKINYLKKHSIISQTVYDVLDHLRKERNEIHDSDVYLSEETRQKFNMASGILFNLHIAMEHKNDKNIGSVLNTQAENQAKFLLKVIKNE